MKTNTLFFVLIVFCTSMIGTTIFAEESPSTGTLVVTYKTDSQGERLDRIRFWLKNEHNKKTLYPKENVYVDDPVDQTRMVVIEDLPFGEYEIDFLIPNMDNYFEKVVPRQLTIVKDEVVKIDQTFKARRTNTREKVVGSVGKLIVSYDFPSDSSLVEKTTLRLVDEEGLSQIHPIEGKDIEVPLQSGKMVMIQDVPVGDYMVEFVLEQDGTSTILASQAVRIASNRSKSVHKALSVKKAELMVSANVPKAVYLLAREGAQKVWKGEGREYFFKDLEPGRYFLTFESTDPFFAPPEPMSVEIEEGYENQVEAFFETHGQLKVFTNTAQAEVIIANVDSRENTTTHEIRKGSGVVYVPAGYYEITFRTSDDRLQAPEATYFQINALENKEVNGYFSTREEESSR